MQIFSFSIIINMANVLDATVRYEANDENQAEAISVEKCNIYEKCTGYLQENFRDRFGE
ncbi:hypothetical protein O3M35_008521 [Rhynocoris fuscipes]|uniref:Uncharacterized protein n=1 Tax=Rhynocoris fuscipes TaxID=488301 RepID=A0AAW1DE00_9HEMI